MKVSLLDTDTLSYIVNQYYLDVSKRAEQYYRVFRFFSVSVISLAEVVEGLEFARDVEGLSQFLQRAQTFEVLPVEENEAILAGQILGALKIAGKKIGELDPFIAATAIVNERPLVTNNLKHYQRIVDAGFPLELENWRNS